MLREIVEELDQNEILGFSKKEKADAREIGLMIKEKQSELKSPAKLYQHLADLSKKGNKLATQELRDLGSDQSYVEKFIKKYLKKI